MTKRKAYHPQTEVDLEPEPSELLEGFAGAEVEAGVAAGGLDSAEQGNEGMEPDLFEDLMASVREAGAILRGEREAARRTIIQDDAESGHF